MSTKFIISFGLILFLFFFIIGCNLQTDPPAGLLTISYPRPGAVFPPEIIPPTITWKDVSVAKEWKVTICSSGDKIILNDSIHTKSWRPTPAQWENIKKASTREKATIIISGMDNGKEVSRSKTWIQTSDDPVEAPIFYRDVPLPFAKALHNLEDIRWRFGSISSPEGPRTVLTNMPVCGNCHSFSKDGKIMGMDADYGTDKGAYAIARVESETILGPEQIISWSEFRPDDGQLTFGLLSQVSPDGRFAVSTVKDRSVFIPRQELHYSQFFFPVQGILALYDRETRRFSALKGADDPKFVQSNPVFSPDGKRIIFARAEAHPLKNLTSKYNPVLRPEDVQEFISGQAVMRYELYSLAFNGGKGGHPQRIEGASDNGRSNFFPKISPDGNWLVYCQADCSMLLRPDSELFILPADGKGKPRRMNCNMKNVMNSWHSWSPNSRWLVFSSKQNGAYTQLWLTHVDEKGNDSPPVLLENFTDTNRAANIPEFVNTDPDRMQRIIQKFTLPLDQHIRRGDLFMGTGDFPKASREYSSALAMSPDAPKIMHRLSSALLNQGRVVQALEMADKAKNLRPGDADVRYVLSICFFKAGKLQKSIFEARKACELNPAHGPARLVLAKALAASGSVSEALPVYEEVLQSGMVSSDFYNSYGNALLYSGKTDEAIAIFRKALILRGNQDEARKNLNKALKIKNQKVQ